MVHRQRYGIWVGGCFVVLCLGTHAAGQSLDLESYRTKVLTLVNQERATRSLAPFKRSATLETAAQSYSDVMMRATAGGAIYLSHLGPDGSTLGSRVSATGYNWYSLGEDLAAGQKSPEQVVAEWMSSPAHRDNLLSRDYREMGLGVAVGPGVWFDGRRDERVTWWTADFGYGPDSDRDSTLTPTPSDTLAPSISGYTTLTGTPIQGAPFSSLLFITGQNLGSSGSVSFHGRPTGIITWTPTAILVFVPLQPSYPDVGPVTLTLGGQTAVGPDFTTLLPGMAPVLVPAVPGPPVLQAPPPSTPAVLTTASPVILDLAQSSGQRITSTNQGTLFLVRGKGFGSRQARVLYITPWGQLDAAIWSWKEDAITVFAPYYRGAVAVAVQTDVNGTRTESNRVSLTIR